MSERIRVKLDSRNRISLTQILPKFHPTTFHLYQEGERLILEPIVEIPAHELWLYKNKNALDSVLRGIEQSKNNEVTEIDIDFSEFVEESKSIKND
jgi:hypothetical protein